MTGRLLTASILLFLGTVPAAGQTFTFTRVVQTGDAPPDNPGQAFAGTAFVSGFPAVGPNGAVTFIATSGTGAAERTSVYQSTTGGPLGAAVPYGSAIPGGVGTFTAFPAFYAIDGDRVVFRGNFGLGQTGLYLHDGTTLHKVIDTTDSLDGKTPSAFLLSPDAIAGDWVTFRASFTDGTAGVYVARFTPVPEPGAALGVAVGGLGLAALTRRRR